MYKKISLAILVLFSISAYAESTLDRTRVSPPYNNQDTRVNRALGVEILDRTSNRKLPVYFYNGKNYVVGEKNHEYQINIFNNIYPSVGRKLAIVSVDGINVITGKTAGYQQSGYVIDANSNMQIKGWRKNMNDIAKFYFTYPENSYAGRTDRPDNTGVIGIAVFNEKYVPPPVVLNESPTFNSSLGGAADSMSAKRAESSGIVAPSSAPAPVQQKSELGTGHGSRERSAAVSTDFERASTNPSETIVLYYDTYEHLVALGIIPTDKSPKPFPNSFVPDPR